MHVQNIKAVVYVWPCTVGLCAIDLGALTNVYTTARSQLNCLLARLLHGTNHTFYALLLNIIHCRTSVEGNALASAPAANNGHTDSVESSNSQAATANDRCEQAWPLLLQMILLAAIEPPGRRAVCTAYCIELSLSTTHCNAQFDPRSKERSLRSLF